LDKISYEAALLKENYLFPYKHLSDIVTADTREASIKWQRLPGRILRERKKEKGKRWRNL